MRRNRRHPSKVDMLSEYNPRYTQSARKRLSVASCAPNLLSNEKPVERPVIVAHFFDSLEDCARSWIAEIGIPYQFRQIANNYTIFFPSYFSSFDTLIVIDNDTNRLKKFIALYEPCVRSKLKIAVMPFARPAECAALLNYGYDDVLDFRIDPIEAKVRIISMTERMRAYHRVRLKKPNLSADDIIHSKLSPKTRSILQHLIEDLGRPVNLGSGYIPGNSRYEKDLASVRVNISAIRRSISHEYEVISNGCFSYTLRKR